MTSNKRITITFQDGSQGIIEGSKEHLDWAGQRILEIPGYRYLTSEGLLGPVVDPGKIITGEIKVKSDLVEDSDKSVAPDDKFDTPYKTKFLHDDRERLLKKNAKLQQVIDFLLKEVL